MFSRKSGHVVSSLIISLVCANLTLADSQQYHVVIDNTWSTATHGSLPFEAHFSWFGGGTHNDQVDFWNVGEVASPGMVQMAETGFTTVLRGEIDAARSAGNADVDINQDHWFCPAEINASSCGSHEFDIDVDSDFPLVTLVSMLGPSPDWFVGVDSLPLHDGSQWQDVTVDLRPYDGGTRSANVFALFGPRTIPPDPIELITAESGQIITPQSLGSMTISRIIDCDFTGDGACDVGDLDELLSIGPIVDGVSVDASNEQYNLDGNGVIDNQDVAEWLSVAATENGHGSPYFEGDANLDGTVDGTDFLAWNTFKFTDTLAWSQGNFNGDSTVDGTDFLKWNTNKFSSSDVSAVPEPASAVLLIWTLVSFFGTTLRRR